MTHCECKKPIVAEKGPKAIGPYSVAMKVKHFIFTAGQAGLDPKTGSLVSGGIEVETRQTMENIKSILAAADANMNDIVKTTVFLKDMNDFSKMNVIYAEYFEQDPPARSTVQVAALPKNALVEIEAIAMLCDCEKDKKEESSCCCK
jgi:2-iminobutanoate/2-iminopropanoate deaminase